jgi:chromosome segregation ATPase
MLFWKNDRRNNREAHINSIEYDFCLKRISELNSSIEAFKSKISLIESDVANLRGKFNQRLKGLKEEEIKVEEKAKDIYTSDELAFG